jgi:hypothetical protein
MATITRRLPKSDLGRQVALNLALNKNIITSKKEIAHVYNFFKIIQNICNLAALLIFKLIWL